MKLNAEKRGQIAELATKARSAFEAITAKIDSVNGEINKLNELIGAFSIEITEDV